VEIALRKLKFMGPDMARTDIPQLTDAEEEMLLWAADDVETWMNDNVAPKGFYFHWEDGEFFLSLVDWDDDDEDDEKSG
jgi:hypothetical protein